MFIKKLFLLFNIFFVCLLISSQANKKNLLQIPDQNIFAKNWFDRHKLCFEKFENAIKFAFLSFIKNNNTSTVPFFDYNKFCNSFCNFENECNSVIAAGNDLYCLINNLPFEKAVEFIVICNEMNKYLKCVNKK